MTLEQEHWKYAMSELINNKCASCQQMTPYKKHYIKVRNITNNKYYIIDAFCQHCYEYYLEGFPWSTNLCEMSFLYTLPKNTRYDEVDVEFHY